MKLYNSYSEKIEEINENPINIYNCGPTVYNHIHIGNARPLIVFDVLYRFLKFQGFTVNYLHNLTDIDDKIIKEAINQNINELELSDFYANEYAKIRKQLNIDEMMIEKVSTNMDGIIEYIDQMVRKDIAYVVNGNVYFDTTKILTYGNLSNRKLDDQIIGERVEMSDEKRDAYDFVLWKNTNIGIKWKSPWVEGRPGWHSECSYLINKHFGNNLTIHGGGIDLKFPHHENENAQHCGLFNCNLAKIWMHVGHVNINNQKMSKSLNNFILMKDILKEYEYYVVRWFMYKTNYQNPLNYNQEIMLICKNEILKIMNILNYAKSLLLVNNFFDLNKKIIDDEFVSCLDNNLNISNGITVIQKNVKIMNQLIKSKDYVNLCDCYNQIINMLNILGIEFANIHNNENIELLKHYFKLCNEGNYSESDKLRSTLIKKGLII